MWMSFHGNGRFAILRMYWDGESTPSVEVPLGDLFASGWGMEMPITSLAGCVDPDIALSLYWLMPFRKSARVTIENSVRLKAEIGDWTKSSYIRAETVQPEVKSYKRLSI
jgi:hypothetical protein